MQRTIEGFIAKALNSIECTIQCPGDLQQLVFHIRPQKHSVHLERYNFRDFTQSRIELYEWRGFISSQKIDEE